MTTTTTIVIKVGTSTLTLGGGFSKKNAPGAARLNHAHMLELARQCALVRRTGCRVILVSSGAIAAGRECLGFPSLPPSISSRQMLAAVGQISLIQLWERLFAIYDLHIGQMLLTRADLEDRERFLNARDMLRAMLEYGIVPVVNENDAVAAEEIKVGDNDNLSALVAVLAEADTLLLLTDQEGLFTGDPRLDPQATLIHEVSRVDERVRSLGGASVSGLGTGGMASKIQAAELATRAGIRAIIAPGGTPEAITAVLNGEKIGTSFSPSISPLESRKRWLFGAPPAGTILVDAGAAAALAEKGGSLLPKGIIEVEGIFSRGAVVRIADPQNKDLAHGVTQYNSEALTLLAGLHSSAISARLGYEYGPVAVHRDDLILMGG
jgi:glutamate 5-kinase